MVSAADFVRLPYTDDLTEGGIAHALRCLPHSYSRVGRSPYEHVRRMVAGTAAELAFRRYLSAQAIPFEIRGATPFTEPDRYDVTLGGRRCEIKSFLLTRPTQIAQVQSEPDALLSAPALVASDLHAGHGRSGRDLYLFAFLASRVAISPDDVQRATAARLPCYIVHVLPDGWQRPRKWSPLGTLVWKSEADEPITLEVGGQDEGRALRYYRLELPPGKRVEFPSELFSLSYIHAAATPRGRVGIHASLHRETHVIAAPDWGNIGVYGIDMLLAGYLTRDEFSRQASFLPAGSHVFQYDHTHVKNLAVRVSELRPLSELFERARDWSAQAAG